jgi:hypothetical protein
MPEAIPETATLVPIEVRSEDRPTTMLASPEPLFKKSRRTVFADALKRRYLTDSHLLERICVTLVVLAVIGYAFTIAQ